MPLPQETIYPVLATRYSDSALALYFTPTAADLAFAQSGAKQLRPQTALLILLKVTQHLHYVPALNDVPYSVIKFISAFLGDRAAIQKRDLLVYERSGTFRRHCRSVRNYLGFDQTDAQRRSFCMEQGKPFAEVKDNLVDILNALIESLIRHDYELPAFATLEKLARSCRASANNAHYDRLSGGLTEVQITRIESLYAVADEAPFSEWQRLKQDPAKPTINAIRTFLKEFHWLRDLAAAVPSIDTLPQSKREQFRYEALALHSSDMRELKCSKRLALAITLIQTQWAQSLDDLTEMLCKLVADLETEGRLAYQEDILENQGRADQLVRDFQSVLQTYHEVKTVRSATKRWQSLENAFPRDPHNLLESCEAHLSRHAHGDRPYVVLAFRKKRALLYDILKTLPVATQYDYHPLMEIKETLLTVRNALIPDKTRIQIDARQLKHFSPDWQKLMILDDRESPTLWVDPYALEAAWFIAIKDALKTFNVYVQGAQKYGDPNELLVSWEEFSDLVPTYGELNDLPVEPIAFVNKLKQELNDAAKDVDERFPKLKGVAIHNDRLVLKKAFTHYKSETLEPLRQAIGQLLPKVSIIDVITDTVRWLNLDKLFKPHSGFEGKLKDSTFRLIVTLFCYGCNIGAQQTKESIKSLSRKQIAWLNARYANQRSLDDAIAKAVSQYASMALPKLWGDGSRAAADGTHRPMYDANLMSEFHLRYRERGAIGYYIVSDQYIALFSHFISCGMHESWFILDGVAQNALDIKPQILHGDTHAQNFVVFGLAYLLGIQLMPRIRGIKHLTFFKADRKTTYQNIEALFDEVIQWKCIEKSLPEMLRIVVSIQRGKITPSAILRRLNTYSQKNDLCRGFQELGKFARTIFLLKCISDPELRKIIHRETNKSEQLNAFLDWLFFGNGGVIRENNRFNQEKIVKYHHLVSALVVLFNTHHMTKALESLRKNGFPINKDDVKHLSPYHTSGINLLGNYHPDLSKPLEPIKTELDWDE